MFLLAIAKMLLYIYSLRNRAKTTTDHGVNILTSLTIQTIFSKFTVKVASPRLFFILSA